MNAEKHLRTLNRIALLLTSHWVDAITECDFDAAKRADEKLSRVEKMRIQLLGEVRHDIS